MWYITGTNSDITNTFIHYFYILSSLEKERHGQNIMNSFDIFYLLKDIIYIFFNQSLTEIK